MNQRSQKQAEGHHSGLAGEDAAAPAGGSRLPAGMTWGYSGIDARTRFVMLLGDPVEHSVSPQLHNAAFRHLNWNVRYGAARVPPARLGQAAAGLGALGLIGANVTVPHKQGIMAHLDEIDPMASRLGAVNTVVNREDGRLYGFNTDAGGFLASLRRDGGLDPTGRTVTVLGAGGAAKAVVMALVEDGAAALHIANRTVERAEALARKAADLGGTAEACPLAAGDGALRRALAASQLVVNATSVGMHPHQGETPLADMDALQAGTLVMDLVCNPRRTRLLQEAVERDLPVLGGLGMLIYQAVLAWEHWFGRPGPADVMRRAAEQALGFQGG